VLVSLAAVERKSSVRAALDAASVAAGAVAAAVRATGVADRDVRTSAMQVDQTWEHGPEGSRPHGFEAALRVSARVRDVASAGAVVAAAVDAGGDAVRIEHVRLALDDEATARRAARELAVVDARAKATQYAQLAGRALGTVESIAEFSAGGVEPFEGGGRMLLDSAAGVPVEAGDQDVVVTVQIRWALV
jgi:uncharacterized protein YggE